jgi:hypothetical protein
LDEGDAAELTRRDDLHDDVRHEPEQVLVPEPDAVVAAVGLALDRDYARDGLHVNVHQRQEGVEVAAVDRLVGLAGQLQVFLRHPRPSIRVRGER